MGIHFLRLKNISSKCVYCKREGAKDTSNAGLENNNKEASVEISNHDNTKGRKKLDPLSRDQSNSVNSSKVKKPSIEERGEVHGENGENKTTETIS